MEFPIDQVFETLSVVLLKRLEDGRGSVVGIEIYDDDRDLTLCAKGDDPAYVQQALNFFSEIVPVSPAYEQAPEPFDDGYKALWFDSNPSQSAMRVAMKHMIAKMEGLGFHLRRLEDGRE